MFSHLMGTLTFIRKSPMDASRSTLKKSTNGTFLMEQWSSCVFHGIKRRRSSARDQGVAKMTTRRARKGFTLKYNPDTHWSCLLYKGLNVVQYKDGCDITNINRDDSSGFRRDTLTTNKQYAMPTIKGHETLTTRTDYVNKYPSTL